MQELVRFRRAIEDTHLPDPDMRLRRYLSGGRLEQDGEWHCEYDADGNLTERYLGTGKWLDGKKDRWRYRWNADGSLAKVVRPDKREVEFTYDALGRRLSKSFGTTVTRWVWNGNVPLHQWKQRRKYSVMEDRWDTDTERRDMTVWLFDEESFVPMAMLREDRSYSILTDQLGTPTEAYDADGNEVWSRVLDMDGNVIEETGNKGMIPFLFQGQYYDRETGLAYNRFRYYSPKTGMYVSQDPIGLAGGILNLYGYVDDTNIVIDLFGLSGRGGSTHQNIQNQLAISLGENAEIEGQIKLKNKKSRFGDVVVRDNDGKIIEVHQIGDMRSRGGFRPSARERGAIMDIREALGDKVRIVFHDKRQRVTLINPDKADDWKEPDKKHRKNSYS